MMMSSCWAKRRMLISTLPLALVVATAAGCGARMSNDPAPRVKEALALRAGGEGAGATAKAAVVTGTGWGTLKGTIKLAGNAPEASYLSTSNKDGAVCGSQVPNETLVVDPASKGIANVVVFARKVSRVKEELAKPPTAEAVFDQKGCLFLSHVLVVRTKQPLILKNSDAVGHNTAGAPPGNPPFNPLLPAGSTAPYQFVKQLSSPSEATCSIHPWMKAYLMARDDPYFAVTKKDGTFEIPNLPAGEDIEFQVWHERATSLTAGKVAKGRVKLKLAENGTEDLQVDVPTATFQ